MFDPSKREQNFDDSKLDACVSTRDGSHVNSAWQALCKGCGPGKKKVLHHPNRQKPFGVNWRQ